MIKNWVLFSLLSAIFVSYFASQIEAKKSKPKGPERKICRWKDVADVGECYERKCTKRRKWKLKLKSERCCKYKKSVLPNLSRKEIDGVMFICFKGIMKEIPLNEMPPNTTFSRSEESISNKTVRTERIVPLELQHVDIFEDHRALFQFSNNEKVPVKLQKDDDGCIYRGSFKEDMDSRVLITGCQGEDRTIQIQSRLYGDVLATIVNGSIVLPNDKMTRVTDTIESHIDYIVNPNFVKQFPNASNVRTNVNIPLALALPIRVYMSPSWRTKYGGLRQGRNKAKEILSHVKYWYLHRSLRTKIHILTVNEEFFETDLEYPITVENLEALGNGVKAPARGHAAIVYLTASTVDTGWAGYAYLSAICDGVLARSISKWHTSDLRTAQIVAHEIGHNLGYEHDFLIPSLLTDRSSTSNRDSTCGPGQYNNGPNNDLMNYVPSGEHTQNKWSDCTNEDFRDYYSKSSSGSTFCLDSNVVSFSETKCVTSPEYPNNYPDDYNSENGAMLSLSVPQGFGIEIFFEDFDVEYHRDCEYDYVQIYNGNGDTEGPKLCGSTLPEKIRITVTSSAAVYFSSDYSIRKRGFKLCYEPIYVWCATVYEHCNMDGEHLNLRDEEWLPVLNYQDTVPQLGHYGHWNDKISSFHVRGGCTLYYGKHHWYEDLHVTTSADSCLVDNGMNDEISSLYCDCP